MGRPHGIRGEVVVNPLSENPERFAPGATLLVGAGPEEAVPRLVAAARPHGGRFVVRFEDVTGRAGAEALAGALLFVAEDELGPLEEGAYWPHQLVGAAVLDERGRVLGTVATVHPRPEQDLWEVVTAGGPVLLPAARDIVRSVDLEGRTIVVEPPAGLFGDVPPEEA